MPAFKQILVCLNLSVCCFPSMALADGEIGFNSDVRPILSEHCFECHGPDENKRQADLRLDIEKAAKVSAIVPGNSAASALLQRVHTTDPDTLMPPPDAKKPLTKKTNRNVAALD